MKKVTIDSNSLAHTKWECKYHIVFAPKYRRKVFYEEKRVEIREILRLTAHNDPEAFTVVCEAGQVVGRGFG